MISDRGPLTGAWRPVVALFANGIVNSCPSDSDMLTLTHNSGKNIVNALFGLERARTTSSKFPGTQN